MNVYLKKKKNFENKDIITLEQLSKLAFLIKKILKIHQHKIRERVLITFNLNFHFKKFSYLMSHI